VCDEPAACDVVGVVGKQIDRLDAKELEHLYRDSAGDVHGYAISLLGDRAAAEDVTALAFERLYRSRARLDRSRGTPRALLFTIARNAALDELRRRRRHPHEGLVEDELAAEPLPAEDIEHAERRATVHAAMLELPLRERELVLLKFHGQLSNGELARVLGLSESNVGTRLHRALMQLRETCAELGRKEVA
jgi:RNA polymerase sigma factor (sigma-70 family)